MIKWEIFLQIFVCFSCRKNFRNSKSSSNWPLLTSHRCSSHWSFTVVIQFRTLATYIPRMCICNRSGNGRNWLHWIFKMNVNRSTKILLYFENTPFPVLENENITLPILVCQMCTFLNFSRAQHFLQNSMCAQRRLRSACASMRSDQSS